MEDKGFKLHGHALHYLLTWLEFSSAFTNMNLTAESHSILLSDGNRIPLLGLGTFGDPLTVRLLPVF